MKFKAEFLIDKIGESQHRDPTGLIDNMKNGTARDLGQKIIEHFPFEKDKEASWPEARQLPDPNNTPPWRRPSDLYRCEVIVLSSPDWNKLGDVLRHIMLDVLVRKRSPDQATRDAMQAIEYYCQPQNT